MKYAVVGGQRREAEPGLYGECPVCCSTMVAKCGERRVWHWAHGSTRICDRWWEAETEWHRDWKNEFPVEWQEQIDRAENGEKHIADVRTEHKWVIEFQHSYLKSDERRAREAFYRQVVWVVDGLRRKRDRSQFLNALKSGGLVCRTPLTWFISSEACALLRDWADSRVPVFFDLGDYEPGDIFRSEPVLWRLDPKSPKGWAHLVAVRRANFIGAFRDGVPCKGIVAKVVKPRSRAQSRSRF
jgi:competence protein CoiA